MYSRVTKWTEKISDVNKDLTCKAKAKAKTKDFTFKAKLRTYVARQ